MSIVSGTIGAIKGARAQDNATNMQQVLANQQAATQKSQYEDQKALFDPYLQAGYKGLGQAQNFDLMQGVGDQPNFDTEYTNKLSAYDESPAYQAQNMLGQQDLARARSARGLDFGAPAAGANASAELSQRLRSTDYDKYRSDLGNRYKALQGEYANRRDVNASKYSQLTDMIKVGQGAASSTGQAGQNYANQAAGIFATLGNNAQQSANNQSAMWGGLGGASANTASTGLKAYDTANKAGWFGGSSGLGSTGGYSAYGAAGSVGPPTAAEVAAIV